MTNLNTAHDDVINLLVQALSNIRHEATKRGSFDYIIGAADYAIAEWERKCERNADGYLVVKPYLHEKASA